MNEKETQAEMISEVRTHVRLSDDVLITIIHDTKDIILTLIEKLLK